MFWINVSIEITWHKFMYIWMILFVFGVFFFTFFLFFCRRSKDKNFEIYRSDIKMANHWWSSYLYPVFRSTFLPFYLSIYLFFFHFYSLSLFLVITFLSTPTISKKFLNQTKLYCFFLNNLFSIRFWISCSLSVEW